jgi:hypothetical protein
MWSCARFEETLRQGRRTRRDMIDDLGVVDPTG